MKERIRNLIMAELEYEDLHQYNCASNNELPLMCNCDKWERLSTLVAKIEEAFSK